MHEQLLGFKACIYETNKHESFKSLKLFFLIFTDFDFICGERGRETKNDFNPYTAAINRTLAVSWFIPIPRRQHYIQWIQFPSTSLFSMESFSAFSNKISNFNFFLSVKRLIELLLIEFVAKQLVSSSKTSTLTRCCRTMKAIDWRENWCIK